MRPTDDFIQCSFECFTDTYIPFLPSYPTTRRSAIAQLVGANRLRRTGPRALEFAEFNPLVWKGPSAHAYFGRLERIAGDIAKCALRGRRARYVFRSRCFRKTGDYTASFQPAMGAVLGGDLEDSVLCRFALSEKDCARIGEMHKDIISESIKILNNDARRSFIFGMTFYGDTMSLWYHSRSHSAVSEPFDYVQNPMGLIRLLTAFTFATPEEMGYDPSISLFSVVPGGDYSFTYTIPSPDYTTPSNTGAGSTAQQSHRYYRTVRSIFKRAPKVIKGRMVRIWEVVEVASVDAPTPTGAPSRVLKDVWLDAEARTEREIQDALFADIDEFLRTPQTSKRLRELRRSLDPYAESYREYFLQIAGASEGAPTTEVPDNYMYRRSGLFSLGYPTMKDDNISLVTPFPPLKRCCTVFSEVCVAISDVDALGDVVDIIEQTLIPLRMMCGAGWVHRDISCGNLLARQDASGRWHIKLADFEYARKFPSREEQHLACTAIVGTEPYMPHEVCTRAFIYPGTPHPTVRDRVVHSPSHDVESLWWLLLKKVLLCGYYNTSSDPTTQESIRDVHYLMFEKMGAERADAFTHSISSALHACLPRALGPAFAEPLDALRDALHRRHWNMRKHDATWERAAHVPVYGYFAAVLRLVRKHPAAGWMDMPVMGPPVCAASPAPVVDAAVDAGRGGAAAGAKRKRASDEENVGEVVDPEQERAASGAMKKCKVEPTSLRYILASRDLN